VCGLERTRGSYKPQKYHTSYIEITELKEEMKRRKIKIDRMDSSKQDKIIKKRLGEKTEIMMMFKQMKNKKRNEIDLKT